MLERRLPDRMREAVTSNNTAMRRDRSRASRRRLPSACNSSRDIWLTRGGRRSDWLALGVFSGDRHDPRNADFALMLGEFYCVTFDAPVFAEVVRENVVYARVYDRAGVPTNPCSPFRNHVGPRQRYAQHECDA
jgi:hypothetical protein